MVVDVEQTVTITSTQLLQLQTWFSPAFPTGAFAFSHGIESAIADDLVVDSQTLVDWLLSIIEYGSGWNDAVFMSAAWGAATEQDWPALENIDAHALALCAGAERDHELRSMGASYAKAASIWLTRSHRGKAAAAQASEHFTDHLPGLHALPVISGAAAGTIGLPLEPFITAALQSSCSNLVWIAARLVPLGQNEALGVIATLAATIQRQARSAVGCTLDDLGGCALMADIASIWHEHLNTRICMT